MCRARGQAASYRLARGGGAGHNCPRARQLAVSMDRVEVAYEPLYQRFLVKQRTYAQQYSHIYTRRTGVLRSLLTAAASAKWKADARTFPAACSRGPHTHQWTWGRVWAGGARVLCPCACVVCAVRGHGVQVTCMRAARLWTCHPATTSGL
ncbi:hypothetical protein EON67_12095 [archaeon]|nr:MAG: hypothetical protein EON67_12095 [archaeon]